jgi:hypothetical protein
MPRAAPSISSFNAGELSPLLDGRSTGNFAGLYASGCRIMQNFLPTIQGPAIGRPGTKFVAELKNSAHRCWLLRFIFNKTQAFILEFGNQYIRFYTDRAQVLSGVAAYEISTPYLVADLTNDDGTCALKFKQSGDVIYITCPGYKPRKLQRFSNTNWVLSEYSPRNGPFKAQNINTNITITGETYSDTSVTNAVDNGSGLIRLTVGSTAGLNDDEWVRVANINGTTEANGRWQVTVISSTTVDLQGSTFTNIFFSSPNGEIRVRSQAGNEITLTASQALFESDHVGSLIELEEGDDTVVKPWETAQPAANTEMRRSDGKTYEAVTTGKTGSNKPIHTSGRRFDGADDTSTAGTTEGVNWLYNDSGIGNVEITQFISSTQVKGIIRENLPYDLTVARSTHRWAFQAWSDVEGYPDSVTIFRERLCFGKGFNVYLSASGDFENMASQTFGEVLPDSAMIVPVLGDETNQIKWIHPVSGGLMVGTEGGESVIRATSISEPLSPSNVETDPQSGQGVRAIQPANVSDRILFTQRSGSKIYDAIYSVNTEKYEGSDQNIRANHIVNGGIVDFIYQRSPYSVLWVATSTGQLLAYTINSSQEVFAWSRHPIGGDGIVESVQSIPSPDGLRDDLWLIVRRTINGQTKRYIEVMMPELGTDDDIEDAFYVDSGATYDGAAVTTITGLDHLEGETVKILADGSVHPDRTVSAGIIQLQRPVSKAQIGLGYRRHISPMRLEAGSANGTAQAKTKRSDHITFRLYNTVGCKVGPDLDKLREIPFRTSSMAMDQPIPLFTGDKRVKWNGGYDRDGYINVVQDDPLPITLVAIYPQVTTYDQG